MAKTKTRKSKKPKRFIPAKWFNRYTVLAVVLIIAVLGVTITYFIEAASFNTNDERVQYNGINFTRASKGLPILPAAKCINAQARAWSQHMAATHTFAHEPNFGTDINKACGTSYTWAAQNIAAASGCTNPPSDNCSQNLYQAFNSPQEIADCINTGTSHYCNIIAKQAQYVGVGAYRDSNNTLWITQDFYNCGSCKLATYTPVAWYLTSATSAASATATRAANVTVKRGQTITLYQDIHNFGPDTASTSKYVAYYHYSATGTALPDGAQLLNSVVSIGSGVVWAHAFNVTIPTTAAIGEKYCSAVFYSNATGPGTSSTNSNKSCATVGS